MRTLIIGDGYIGARCHEEWEDSVISDRKIYSSNDVLRLISMFQPDAVLNAAGVKGYPNVDWCETHQLETAEGNINLPLYIAQACAKKDIYMLHISSGCIFYGDSPSVDGWKEEDIANPTSYYSKTKYAADLALQDLPNVGIARIRIPMDDRHNRANILDKLASYPKIIDVSNSITVIPDMIEVFHKLLEKRAEGVFHVTNPGSISYRAVMAFYQKYVNPKQTNEWIDENDLVEKGLTLKTRSTNVMQSTRLGEIGIKMPDVYKAVERTIREYAKTAPGWEQHGLEL